MAIPDFPGWIRPGLIEAQNPDQFSSSPGSALSGVDPPRPH